MIKKRFIFFLLVITLAISSCDFESEYSEEVISRPSLNSVDNGNDESKVDRDDLLGNIEGYDYGEKSFVIVTTDKSYFEAESGTSLIEKAVIDRNGSVEVKFNINIEVKEKTSEEILKEAPSALSKGEHYADLIAAPANILAELMDKGCLLNMNVLPYVDLSADYVDPYLTDSSQINGKLYMLFGDMTQTEYSSWCVFYNGEFSEKTGIDPYALYKNGEWTWEKFLEYSEKVSKYSKSGFVTTATQDEFVNALWATTGNKFFGDCANSPMELPSVENGKAILSSIRKIIKSSYYGKNSGKEAVTSFIDGKSGMLLCRRNAVYEICESGMDWHAVPMPKYNSEGKHYSYIDGEAMAVSVMKNVEDTDFVGRVLNGLIVSSSKLIPQSVNNNELYFFWKDNSMAVEMEETKKNLYLDIGIIYAYAVKDIATVTTENIKTSLNAGIAPFQFYHSTKNQFRLYASENFG